MAFDDVKVSSIVFYVTYQAVRLALFMSWSILCTRSNIRCLQFEMPDVTSANVSALRAGLSAFPAVV
jgi:hypothetical protein